MRADALRAQDWAGEPFLHDGEDAAEVLAPGTARRAALDEALAEIEAGRSTPTSRWKVRFGFMLGLERVLSSKPPTTAAGTELRKHQIDALAGMLTELIAANQRHVEDEENGNGHAEAEVEHDDAEDEDEVAEDDAGTSSTTTSRRASSARIPAPFAATASGTRPRRARRSRPRASSRRRARWES